MRIMYFLGKWSEYHSLLNKYQLPRFWKKLRMKCFFSYSYKKTPDLIFKIFVSINNIE